MDDFGGVLVFGEGMKFVLLFVTNIVMCAKIKNISSSLTVDCLRHIQVSFIYRLC